MKNTENKYLAIDINGIRIWAIFCVVFQHVLNEFDPSNSISDFFHWFITYQALYSFLLLSGLALRFNVYPKKIIDFSIYLKKDILKYFNIYTIFFSLQIIQLLFLSFVFHYHEWSWTFTDIILEFLVPSQQIVSVIWYLNLLIITLFIFPFIINIVNSFLFWPLIIFFYFISYYYININGVSRILECLPILIIGYKYGVSKYLFSFKRTLIYFFIWFLSFVILSFHKLEFINNYINFDNIILNDFVISNKGNLFIYIIKQCNHLIGAYFWMAVVGAMFAKFRKYKLIFSKLANSSLDIYLIHKPFLLFIFSYLLIKPILVKNSYSYIEIYLIYPVIISLVIFCLSLFVGKILKYNLFIAHYAFGIHKALLGNSKK